MTAVPEDCGATGCDAALLVTYLVSPDGALGALLRNHPDRNATMIIFETASRQVLAHRGLRQAASSWLMVYSVQGKWPMAAAASWGTR